jgi:DNA-binding NtrC family response regulator
MPSIAWERHMPSRPLGLVPFATDIETRGLLTELMALGQPATIIAPETWFNNSESDYLPNPILIFLGAHDCPSEAIRSTLAARRTSAIAIFARNVSTFSPEIAASCHDFIYWPCEEQELVFRIERLHGSQESRQTPLDETALLEEFTELNLLGRSHAFVSALRLIKRIARCDAPVLIQGETGTGKELAARAIHYLGTRRDFPFIPLNCGAIPDNLIESELFGHERGAFTDAKISQSGVIALAEGGSLFLDEVDALSPKGQVVLLRYLQDQHYRALGGRMVQRGNTRIIAATNADLDRLVERGVFRRDLLFRLNVTSLALPALRERTGDSLLLAEHFLSRYRQQYDRPDLRLCPDAIRWLDRYTWPGNVRELENLVHRECLLAEGDELQLGRDERATQNERRRRTGDRRGSLSVVGSLKQAKNEYLAAFEKRYLENVLTQSAGNVSLAARIAGKERRALGKLLRRHSIDRARYLRR